MDYKRLYDNIIKKAKESNRKRGASIYYEAHHINPDFMFKDRKRSGPKGHLDGNPDSPDNLVLLTSREHILCHILLAKSLKGKRYWAQAASSLVWFYTKVIGSHPRQNIELGGLINKYERYREIGIVGISAARKGKFPAVDSRTGEKVGSVNTNHPNVIAGIWVHVTKGQVWSDERRAKQPRGEGKLNHNSRWIDTEYVISKMLEYSNIVKDKYDNNFIGKQFVEWFDAQPHHKIFYKYRNIDKTLPQKLNGLSRTFLNIVELAKSISPETGWVVPKYGMGAKYRKAGARYYWVTDGVTNIKIIETNEIPNGYRKGRTINVKNKKN